MTTHDSIQRRSVQRVLSALACTGLAMAAMASAQAQVVKPAPLVSKRVPEPGRAEQAGRKG